MELWLLGYQVIRMQDTTVSEHQVKKEKRLGWYPDTLMSLPTGRQALPGHLIP